MKAKLFVIFVLVVGLVIIGSTFTMAQEAKAQKETKQESKKEEEVQKLDINSAAPEELETLPGIGPKLAQAIIAGRPYEKIQDLLEIKGIGEKMLKKFENLIEVKPIKGEEEEVPPEQAEGEQSKKKSEKKN
ncbi:helix-hairpin-helix motif protein [Candidatus Vecturithrix granuli]|uniref:Helix-hairpin-helix motif protein n=1 Tax=Vecturithrix granuli TaxID=1499967 RepID=A0A081C6G7_VECG1|nr:helix-hairpin-helix motif protein [Candidatus Vecturithrix granuli]